MNLISAHQRVVHSLIVSNRELISPILFVVLLSCFSGNVYSVSRMVLEQLPASQQALLGLVMGLETIMILIPIQTMIFAVKVLHRPASALHKGGRCLSSGQLSVQLKVAHYYELLHCNKKLAFSLGPFGKITSNSLFEVRPGRGES